MTIDKMASSAVKDPNTIHVHWGTGLQHDRM